jgi:hypothetical protein
MNITKLLQALPTQTVREIRSIFISRMMKSVSTGDGFVPNIGIKALGGKSTGTLNGKLLNNFLNENRSIVSQMFDRNFFDVYRSMGDVLEMLQAPLSASAAKDTSMAAASKNAALFIDMIYGPLNHKRLILNRASRLFDKMGLSSDNLMLFSDYGLFVEAAQKNFLAGNYPRWMTKLPQKERGVFITKAMKLINKTIDFANLGLNRGAGLRKMFTANPLKNPMLAKEYLEDKYEGDDDRMEDNADMFFPVDVLGKYAIKSLMAVFGKGKEVTLDKVTEAFSESEKVQERNLKEEEFIKKLEN